MKSKQLVRLETLKQGDYFTHLDDKYQIMLVGVDQIVHCLNIMMGQTTELHQRLFVEVKIEILSVKEYNLRQDVIPSRRLLRKRGWVIIRESGAASFFKSKKEIKI